MRKCWDFMVFAMLIGLGLSKSLVAIADQKLDMATMSGISHSAQFDYGYISEREIKSLSVSKPIDFEIVKNNDIAFKKNMNKALNLSLLDLNQMMLDSKEQEYTGDPIFQKISYLGADVHLHMMHIDYAQALMQEWMRLDSNLNQPYLGAITDIDIGFYLKNSFKGPCHDGHKYGLCFSAYSPTLRGLFALGDYADDLREVLIINDGDVLTNYRSLINNLQQLEDRIANDLKDSCMVGLKEYQEREQKRNSSFKRGTIKQSLDYAQENGMSKAALSTQREVVAAHLEGKVDAMISLDDLPNGYVDPYEKKNKQFKLEYILKHNAKVDKQEEQAKDDTPDVVMSTVADPYNTPNLVVSNEMLYEQERILDLVQEKEESLRDLYVEQIPSKIDRLIEGANEVLPIGHSDLTKKCYESYRKHKGHQLVQPIMPFNVKREQLYAAAVKVNKNMTQAQIQKFVNNERRPTFKDRQGTYFDYSLLFHVSNDQKNKGQLILGTEEQG